MKSLAFGPSTLAHTPVMLNEALEFLDCKNNRLYVDATVGLAGHAEAILESSSPFGRLLGIDRDPVAAALASKRLGKYGKRVKILHARFAEIIKILKDENIKCADGILADLGVSSHQILSPSRGFGFSTDAPLDMRMDPSSGGPTAADIIARFDEKKLSNLIYALGEERFAKGIARAIVKKRKEAKISTTKELAQIIFSVVPIEGRRKIHPATKTFQALRIFINDELQELQNFLDNAPNALCENGRMVVISFHSLEDRLVKTSFKKRRMNGGYKIITKKILTPSVNEIKSNPRARSAKMRVLERIS